MNSSFSFHPALNIVSIYHKFFSVILICFLMLASGQSFGQKYWSLEDCIEYALDNNITIKQQNLAVDMSEIDVLQSKVDLLPNLNGSFSYGFNFGKRIDPFTNTFATDRIRFNNFYFSSSVYLFNGFQLMNNMKKKKIDLQADMFDLDKLKDDISLAIATAYLNILFKQEMYNNSRGQLEVTSQQVDRTSKLVEAGTLAKGSLLIIEAQMASEEKNVIDAENLHDLSILTLVQYLDLATTEGFEILKPELSLPDEGLLLSTPENIYEFALTNQPEIQSAELKVESAARDLSLARGTTSPNLTIQGSVGTGYSGASSQVIDANITGIDTLAYTIEPNPVPVGIPQVTYDYETVPFNSQFNDNFNQSLALYLNIPIFNGLNSRNGISRAKIGIVNAEYELQLVKNKLYKTIQQSYADASAALKWYKASQRSYKSLLESFNYTEQKFNVGMVNSVEYNDAKNKLAVAESEVLQAKYEFIFRRVILDFYMGKPIRLK